MRQWQEELHEKMNLDVPRYDKGAFLDRFDQPHRCADRREPVVGIPDRAGFQPPRSPPRPSPADPRRRPLGRGPRRRGAPRPPTRLQSRPIRRTRCSRCCRRCGNRQMWQALYLASATPMQMHPHEAWDLIALLGLKGKWGESAELLPRILQSSSRDPKHSRMEDALRDALRLLLGPAAPTAIARLEAEVQRRPRLRRSYAVTGLDRTRRPGRHAAKCRTRPPSGWTSGCVATRRCATEFSETPARPCATIRLPGIIPEAVIIPYRHVDDDSSRWHRTSGLVRAHRGVHPPPLQRLQERPGHQALGFIMTVYRRRLTSSFEAIKRVAPPTSRRAGARQEPRRSAYRRRQL